MWHVPKLRELVAAVVAEEKTPKPEKVVEQPGAAKSHLAYITLTEADVAENLGIALDELVTLLVSEGLFVEEERLPTEDAESSGYLLWVGDEWSWSVPMLSELIARRNAGPITAAEEIPPDATTPTEQVTTAPDEDDAPDELPIFSFPDEPTKAVAEDESALPSEKQLADRMADLERENQTLRDRLVDSERRRIAAEERVKLLEGRVKHLAAMTPQMQILEYTMTVRGESGERIVWRSPDADTTKASTLALRCRGRQQREAHRASLLLGIPQITSCTSCSPAQSSATRRAARLGRNDRSGYSIGA